MHGIENLSYHISYEIQFTTKQLFNIRSNILISQVSAKEIMRCAFHNFDGTKYMQSIESTIFRNQLKPLNLNDFY